MPSKYNLVTDMYGATVDRVTKTPEEWTNFLNTMAWNYKYNFADQILIYAQKPEATACADIDTWNTKLKRWINKGAKGIALIEEKFGENGLKYVFDVSDTNSIYRKNIVLWNVPKQYKENIIESLENKFGDLDTKDTLANSIISVAFNLAVDNFKDYDIDEQYLGIVSLSTAYVMLERCKLNPLQYFSRNDLQSITEFTSYEDIHRIGTLVSDISEMGLSEIQNTIKNLQIEEKNKIHTFEDKSKQKYNESINNKNIERSEENDRIQSNRRLSNTESSTTRGEQRATGQIRTDEINLSEGEQESRVHSNEDEGRIKSTSIASTDESERTRGTDIGEMEEEQQSNRRIEGERPNAVGRVAEQLSPTSSGYGATRSDILSLENEQQSLFPTIEQQLNIIEQAGDKTSAFSIDEINYELLKGSNFVEGKYRIYEQFQKSLSITENAEFLKKEYGTGGWSYQNSISAEYSAKGFSIYEPTRSKYLSWDKVAEYIKELIRQGKYLDETELKYYNEVYLQPTPFEDRNTVKVANEIISSIGNEETKEELLYFATYNGNKEMWYGNMSLEQVISDLIKKNHTINEIWLCNSDSKERIEVVYTGELAEEKIEEVVIVQEKQQFKITDDNLGVGTPKERYKNNIEAIKVLLKCEEENRLATPEEQEVLSKYVGWGGLPDAFDKDNSSWASEYLELKSLLSEEEYTNARESTLTAFYTPPVAVKSIYTALDNMGFTKGNILEPSCGTGNFIGMLPENMRDSKVYGVELDSISGKIAKQLYQKSNIQIKGFEKTDYNDNFFDVAIGNVPFGNFKLADKRYDKNNFLIHDYFFAKTLDKVRPNGIVAFITSKGTLDKESESVRKYISERAEFLGAIRLPDNTFKANAGTEVTSDIIFLQKRDHIEYKDQSFVKLGRTEDNIEINQYFVDHPEMIIGKMEMESTRYGFDSACKLQENQDFEELLNNAIQDIKAQVVDYALDDDIEELEDTSIPADMNIRNFSYTLVDGKIYYRENSKMNLQELSVTAENRVKGMIAIRDSVRKLIELQTEDFPDDEIQKEQSRLNTLYDEFTKKYGLINSRGNSSVFSDDSSYCLLCSLEILDNEGNIERKAVMFSKRTIKPHKTITKVDTPSEALAVSIAEKGKVDIAFMQDLVDVDMDKMLEGLQGIIFRVPVYGDPNVWVTADEYLSGNVREKLEMARIFFKDDSTYEVNVKALEQVIPKDLTASEIKVKLGSTWIDTDDIQDFVYELLETPRYAQYNIKVRYSDVTAEWNIQGKNYDSSNIKAHSTFGTKRVNAYKIIEDTLNLKDVRVYDNVVDEDGNKTRVLNKKETAIAMSKQEIIKQEFEDWIWQDPERRERLTRKYNDKFNSIRPREYDGRHITFGGINPEIKLREHQVNAIAHILYGNNTLLAHEVGAGKTFEMVAGAMESKRLGLCNKSLFVIPNHIIEQFASEFLWLYPSANILVATKKDFETQNRKKFCSRIATGDYDAVIIGHSQFEKIPMSVERQRNIIEEQIDEITMGIDELKRNNGERYSIKQLEKTKRMLKTKLEKLNDTSRKDDVVTFEELGVDKLFVDEAHRIQELISLY